MTFDEFKADALRTESKPQKLNFSLGGLTLLLGVASMTASIVDQSKKTMFYGKSLDTEKINATIDKLKADLTLMQTALHRIAIPEDVATEMHMPNMRIAHGAIGMFTESAELLDAVADQIRTGKLDLTNVAEETGDSDWYKAIIHDEAGISEEESRAKVIAKLKARYGDKFSNESALNRDLSAERAVLEAAFVPV
jgi:NTP pyrophosphatase (non-canonical NTP hydrolase)